MRIKTKIPIDEVMTDQKPSTFPGMPLRYKGEVIGKCLSASFAEGKRYVTINYEITDKQVIKHISEGKKSIDFGMIIADAETINCDLKLPDIEGVSYVKPFNEVRIKIILSLAYDFVYVEYMTSMLSLKKPKYCNLDVSRGQQIIVMNMAMKDYKDYDAILLTEWDHKFDPDALEKLWDMNVPAASALFKSRKGDHNWLLIDETKPEGERYVQPASMDKPFRMDCTGLGFMLIRKEALDKMKQPFFEPFLHLHNNIDRTFCRKIKDAGFDLMINPQVRLGHKCSEMIY